MTTKALSEEQIQDVRRVSAEFSVNVPIAAQSSGVYRPEKDDPRFLASREFKIPNGTYRVLGNDWLFTFKGNKLVEAARAQPPGYGGDKVVHVPSDD